MNMESSIFRWLNSVVVTFAAFMFVFIPTYCDLTLANPTQSSKSILFSYSVTALALVFVGAFFFRSSIRLSINAADAFFTALFVYVLLNRFLIQSHHGFSLRYFDYLGLCVLYLILRNFALEYLIFLLLAAVLGAVIQSVHGNLQLWGVFPSYNSNFRMTGSFFNPGPYAGYLACIFATSIGILLFRKRISVRVASLTKKRMRIVKLTWCRVVTCISVMGIVSVLSIIMASHSRAAWMALFAVAVYYVIVDDRVRVFVRKIKDIPTLGRVGVVLIALVFTVSSLLGLYFYKRASSEGRLLVWHVATEMISDAPLFGVGIDGFKAHYMHHQADHFKTGPVHGNEMMIADNVYYAFNSYLQFAAENGLLGVLLGFGLLLVLCIKQRGKNDPVIVTVGGGMIAILIFALFSYPEEILAIKICMILFLSTLAAGCRPFFICSFEWKKWLRGGVGSGVVVAAVSAFILLSGALGEIYRSYRQWQEASDLYDSGRYQESVQAYERVFPLLQNNGEFLAHYGKALSMAKRPREAIQVLSNARLYFDNTVIQVSLGDSYRKLNRLQEAEQCYLQGWYMVPNRFYPKYLLAKMHDDHGNRRAAVAIAQELLIMDVKIESKAIDEMKKELRRIVSASDQ